MKTKFTKTERLISGIYFAAVATLSLAIMFGEPQFLTAVFLGGFFSGVLVPPALLTPNKHSVSRSILTGCLTTLVAALFAALFLSISLEFNLDQPTAFALSDINSNKIQEVLTGFLPISLFAIMYAIPFSILGAIAAVVFSYKLVLFRNSIPEINA